MVKLNLSGRHKKWISIVMIVMVLCMLGDAVYQIAMHSTWQAWIPESLAAAGVTTQPASETQPADGGKDKKDKPGKPPELLAAIKKRNVFVPVKKEHHGLQLTGVIGKTALFNKGAIEEGQSGHGVKVVSIEGYVVTIEYKGNQEVMKLFEDAGKNKGGPGPPSASSGPSRERGSSRPAAVVAPVDGAPVNLRGPGRPVSPEELRELKEAMRREGVMIESHDTGRTRVMRFSHTGGSSSEEDN